MAFTPNTTPTLVRQPRYFTASIGNGDASAWKFLYDGSGVLAGTNGDKVVAIRAASTDTSSRVVQLAKCRTFAGATISIATPGVVTWSLTNGNTSAVGDQIVFLSNGDTLPTGLSFNTTYFVISGGFTFGTSFELATSAGGAAINTSGSQSGTHLIALVRPMAANTVAITAGTDGVTSTASLFALDPAAPQDNDGQAYEFIEANDAFAVSATTTVTANKMISIHGVAGDF